MLPVLSIYAADLGPKACANFFFLFLLLIPSRDRGTTLLYLPTGKYRRGLPLVPMLSQI
jgi:hypothetical protein